jgi:hypothetical protein
MLASSADPLETQRTEPAGHNLWMLFVIQIGSSNLQLSETQSFVMLASSAMSDCVVVVEVDLRRSLRPTATTAGI